MIAIEITESGKQATRTFISVVIALSVYRYFNWPEGYWLVLASLLTLQIRQGDTFYQHILIVTLCGLLSATVAFISNAIAANTLLLSIFLFCTTLISVRLSWFYG